MTTDGRLAVIRLNDCTSPQTVQISGDTLLEHGAYLQRLLRRQILSFRSDMYRTNLYWRSYEGTRWLVLAIKHRHPAEDPDPAPSRAPSSGIAASLLAKARNSSWLR